MVSGHHDGAGPLVLPLLRGRLRDPGRRRPRPDGGAERVGPGAGRSPTTRCRTGYTCPKGRALGAWHHHPDRLDRPCARATTASSTAHRGTPRSATSPARSGGLIAEHGPDAVGVLLATGSAFDSATAGVSPSGSGSVLGSRSKYTSATIDTPCKPLVSRLMSGFPGLVPTLDPSTARLTLFLGCNPVVSHGHLNGLPDPVVDAAPAHRRRRELWVIDPRRTETARLATRHLALRPGTDHVLLAHLVREVLARRRRPRLPRRPHRTRRRRRRRRARRAVRPRGRPRRAATCRPPSSTTSWRPSARHGRVSAQTGTGTTMSRAANLTEWLLWVLHIVTGSFDRPGGMWFNPGFLRRPRPPAPGRRPVTSPADGPASRPELPDWLGEFPCAALCDEIEAGNLRALVVFGGNPLRSFPDARPHRGRLRPASTPSPCSTSSPPTRPRSPPTCCPVPVSSSGPTCRWRSTSSARHAVDPVHPGRRSPRPRTAGRRGGCSPSWPSGSARPVLPDGLTADDRHRRRPARARSPIAAAARSPTLHAEASAVAAPVYGWVTDGRAPRRAVAARPGSAGRPVPPRRRSGAGTARAGPAPRSAATSTRNRRTGAARRSRRSVVSTRPTPRPRRRRRRPDRRHQRPRRGHGPPP